MSAPAIDALRTHLTERLSEFRGADAEEEGLRERMLVLARAPGDPFTRARFSPGHFTASGFLVKPDGEAVLLILHRKLARWLQPGGHVEPTDESLEAAARRELSEEVGVDEVDPLVPGIVDLDIHPIPARGAEPAHEHFDVRFAWRARSDAFRVTSEVVDVRWVRFEDLAATGSDRSVQRAAAKLAQCCAALNRRS